MDRSTPPSGSQQNVGSHRQPSSPLMEGLLPSAEEDVIDPRDAVVTSGVGEPMLAPEASSPRESLDHSNQYQHHRHRHLPPAPEVDPNLTRLTANGITLDLKYHDENEISGKDYIMKNYFESTANLDLDRPPSPLPPAITTTAGTAIVTAVADKTNDRVGGVGSAMPLSPKGYTVLPTSKSRRRSTQGYMSPPRRHPYKSSRHPVKLRPFVLPTAADNSDSSASPLQKDPVAAPGRHLSQQESMELKPRTLPANALELHSEPALRAYWELQKLLLRLEEVRPLQVKPRLPHQRTYSESDAQNEFSIVQEPTPMDISKSIYLSREASPSPGAVALTVMVAATSHLTSMDISRTVQNSRAASPSPLTAAAAATVVASSFIRTVEQQEQNVPSTPSSFPTTPGFSATPHILQEMSGEVDEDEERLEEADERKRPQKKQHQEQEQINTPSDQAGRVRGQDHNNLRRAMQGGSDDMDDVISEKAPEELEQDLETAHVDSRLAFQAYKAAESNLRTKQERVNAIEFEKQMRQSRSEDWQQQQQQQTPSGATASRHLEGPLTSMAPLFSASSSRGNSVTPSTTDSEPSQGFNDFIQERPPVYPPPSPLMRQYQQQNQQMISGNRSHSKRNSSTSAREIEAKAPMVDKGKCLKVRDNVLPADDPPLVDRRFNRRMSSARSPSLLPTGKSTQRSDSRHPAHHNHFPPMQTQQHQNHPRGRAHCKDYQIPSSVGSSSDRHTEDEFFSDLYHDRPCQPQKRASTTFPSETLTRGPNTPHQPPLPQIHRHQSQRNRPPKSPRVKKQSSCSSPGTRSPPPSPVYDHPLSSSGLYPSQPASRIVPPPALQRFRNDPPPAQSSRPLVDRPMSRAASYTHLHSHPHYQRCQSHQRHSSQRPKRHPQQPQRHHRQQHQHHQIQNPMLDQFLNKGSRCGGTSSFLPKDTTAAGQSASAEGSAAHGGCGNQPIIYYKTQHHHYHYSSQPTSLPSSYGPPQGHPHDIADGMMDTCGNGGNFGEDWENGTILSDMESDSSDSEDQLPREVMMAGRHGEEDDNDEEDEGEGDESQDEEEEVVETPQRARTITKRSRKRSWFTRSQAKLRSPTF